MEGQTQSTPLVSIGMAVYNGEKYLDEAIRSILAQTYTNFELIISDNASTDRTAEICQRYAAQDARIRYSRNETNIGGANNENLTFRLSRGKYFRWAAHDDICAPELIERCVEVLETHPEVVLCHTTVIDIDDAGKVLRYTRSVQGSHPSPFQRFREISDRSHACEATYGLVRSEIIRRTRLQLNYTDSDRVFLCELALYGPFYQIQEPLFYKRHHAGNRYLDWRGRMAWFLPSLANTGSVTFPNWMELYDLFVTIGRVKLPLHEKLLCYLWLIPWALMSAKRLAKDLAVAVYMLLQPKEQRKAKYVDTSNWA